MNHLTTVFEEEEDIVNKSFFSEIISSISDVRFSKDGRYILSRDYLTLKIWDVNMEKKPVKTINMHEPLKNKLCDLYENDCIFDKFECTFSGDGKHALSGSYNNNFMIYPTDPNESAADQAVLLQADKSAFKAKKGSDRKNKAGRGFSPAQKSSVPVLDADKMDYSKKILHSSWHPREDSIAIAATNNVRPLIHMELLTFSCLSFRLCKYHIRDWAGQRGLAGPDEDTGNECSTSWSGRNERCSCRQLYSNGASSPSGRYPCCLLLQLHCQSTRLLHRLLLCC
jgi:WD40 repeat protein